jgi:hypothetical protein
MFSNEEQLFLNTIASMLSPNNQERIQAEENIKKWIKETYLQVLQSCNKFIICEQLKPDIRRYACYVLQLLTKEDCYENWRNTALELKMSVQQNSLGLLGNKEPGIRQSACTLVNSICVISIKDRGWPDLINILCKACTSDTIEFKISAVKTLGMIWDSLPREAFSLEEQSMMENAIIQLLSMPQNPQLSLECLIGYQAFMDYIKNKFADKNYLESSLKMLISYCTINNINTEKVAEEAIHTISKLIIIAYNYIEPHFKNISEFFFILCTGNSEELAVQSYILFTDISIDEIDRKNKNFNYKKYLQSIWDKLWVCIQHSLNNRTNLTNDEGYSRYDALSALLYNLSLICDEKIIDDIFAYMGGKLNDNNPMIINSAIYAFGSIVETAHKNKIESVIPDSIHSIGNLFNKKCDELNITLSWCFNQICSSHAKIIIKNPNVFKFLITTISSLLKDQSLGNKAKMHLCESIYKIASYIFEHNYQDLNVFSDYLQDLLGTLEALAYFPQSYNTQENLSEKCFEALSSLLEISTEKDQMLISYFMEKIYNRLGEAQNLKNFGDSKDKMFDFQSFLCHCVQSLCKNLIVNLIKLDNQKIENYFNIIENFFKIRQSVFEEGFLALSGLITLISNNEFEKLVGRIMSYIFHALKNYKDAKNCETACLSLIDIIRTSKEKFVPYIKEIYPLFNNIIKAEDSDKKIFTLIIIVYSDLFGFVGEQIWAYYEEPMNYMNQIISFCVSNHEKYLNDKIDVDEYNYFIKLNDGLVDYISSVAEILTKEDEVKQEAFKNYIPDILDYLGVMMGNPMFNPNNNYLDSCISFVISLAEIYKKYILKKINDYTLQRIFTLANDSNDENVIHLKDYLQNLIFTIRMQS